MRMSDVVFMEVWNAYELACDASCHTVMCLLFKNYWPSKEYSGRVEFDFSFFFRSGVRYHYDFINSVWLFELLYFMNVFAFCNCIHRYSTLMRKKKKGRVVASGCQNFFNVEPQKCSLLISVNIWYKNQFITGILLIFSFLLLKKLSSVLKNEWKNIYYTCT